MKKINWIIITMLIISMVTLFSMAGCKQAAAGETTVAAGETAAAVDKTITTNKEGKQIVVGHIVYTMEHQFHQGIANALTDYGEKYYGAKVIILDGGADSEKTLTAVENLISQNVDAISIHSPDMALTSKSIKLAHAAGIPIVTTLIYPEDKSAPHVQPMEAPASLTEGKVAATKWLETFPDKPCKVAILDFGKWEQGEVLRFGPFVEGVKSVDPKAELVTVLNGQGSTDESMKITLDILQANPDVNIIFGGNDEMALGALAACEQVGRGVMNNGTPLTEIIAGVDGGPAALIKVYSPNSSFKITQGAVRDVARAEMDAMMGMIEGKIDMNKFQIIEAYVKPIDFWNTSIEDAQVFLVDNYLFTGNLADEIVK
ncbi:MAG: sugar ABC transporter substrate-binding protein [Nitrososphaeraceae archaeon]